MARGSPHRGVGWLCGAVACRGGEVSLPVYQSRCEGYLMSEMGRLEFTTPRNAWGGEATDFTPLLAQPDMLEYLAAATSIGTLIPVDVEHATAGNRSLDILAETADGRRVSIENQYGVGDHDHLTRGLAYAVATDSAALIVVAEDHRDEFVSVADYLNELAGQAGGIRVWLVQVRAVRRRGDTVWSPEFVVRAAPNEWEDEIRRETTPGFATLEEFYDKCSETAGLDWAETARVIMEQWKARAGATEHHGNKAQVSLYYPSPKHDGGVNVLSVNTNGTMHVSRGYIWETAGVYDPEVEPEELDDAIRRSFPDAVWTGRNYYVRIPNPQPDTVAGFADWLTARFDKAIADSLDHR